MHEQVARPAAAARPAQPGHQRIRVVVDTDPGIDDAAAILLALASPEVDVVGLTTVAGNAPLATTTQNACKLLELADRTGVPVAAGADAPLLGARPGERSASVHGEDGLGGALPGGARLRADRLHAVELLAAAAAEGPLTVVAIGPLTNLALALAMHPELIRGVERVVVMGGARRTGNVTAAAEFNVWCDPEAAARVVGCGVPLTLLPLDVTHEAVLTSAELDTLASSGRPGERLAAMVRAYGSAHRDGFGEGFAPLHDVLAVIAVVAPELIGFEDAVVEVDTGTSVSRGATLVDTRAGAAGRRSLVGTTVDRRGVAQLLVARIGALGATASTAAVRGR